MPEIPAYQVDHFSTSQTLNLARLIVYDMEEESDGVGGGWTLIMKMDGTMETATYYSSLWIDKHATKTISLDLSESETKLPFIELRLGMVVNGVRGIPTVNCLSLLNRCLTRSLTVTSKLRLLARQIGKSLFQAL